MKLVYILGYCQMIELKDADIGSLLEIVDRKFCDFGVARDALDLNLALKRVGYERHTAFFQFISRSAYGVVAEAQNLGSDPDSGPVKFEIRYYDKHPIGRSAPPKIADPRNLGELLSTAYKNHLDFDYMAQALERAGLKWTDGLDRNRAYTCDAVISGVQSYVRVDLREIPENPKFPRLYDLEISVKVFPQLMPAPAPPPKPEQKVSSGQHYLPFKFAVAKPVRT